jgi:transposase
MPRAYTDDFRARVIDAVESGSSRREAAESVEVSASSAVRWLQRWRRTGSASAKTGGGSTSSLERHTKWLLALVAAQPDITLDEVVIALNKRRIRSSRSAVWRFFDRHDLTFKKKPARRGARTSGRGSGTSALGPRARHA